MKQLVMLALVFCCQGLVAITPDEALTAYFSDQCSDISSHCLSDIHNKEEWLARRPEYHRQLAEMLGLWPEPPRTALRAVVTGTLTQADFIIEKIQFQSMPGLYVTADLYLPKQREKPVPGILYVCGHSPMKRGDVSLGNKTAYQHHGEWFARNGYACLIPDTLQLGEIEGIHHGLYREKMWWWLSRGYTPAGVEVWNSMRCLDYLQSRPEIDPNRLGMTGRSGGGAYTWYTAALDQRIKVAVPVAGMTDLHNQIVDGVIEGHCDCMFMVNQYRWDFPLVAALIAPRPLLIGNSDKDTIFPLDGVLRLHAKTAKVYQWYGAEKNLGLLITEGPHEDTQDLQVPAFRWFNRFLKDDAASLKDANADARIDPVKLTVFSPHQTPANQINSTVQELFVPAATRPAVPQTKEDWAAMRDRWMKGLRRQTFAGWPEKTCALEIRQQPAGDSSQYSFISQDNVPLHLTIAHQGDFKKIRSIELEITDQPGDQTVQVGPDITYAFFSPRGLGADAWTADEKKLTHIQRRFWLLGQTVDGMRVWDVRRAIAAVREMTGSATVPITLKAKGRLAGIALYASLFEQNIAGLDLSDLSASHRHGPDLLNVMKVLDMPEALSMAVERCPVRIHSNPADWAFTTECVKMMGWSSRLQFLP